MEMDVGIQQILTIRVRQVVIHLGHRRHFQEERRKRRRRRCELRVDRERVVRFVLWWMEYQVECILLLDRQTASVEEKEE